MIELTKGHEFELPDTEGRPPVRLTIGIGWDHERNAGLMGTGAPEIDLDASAMEFAGGQLMDLAVFNNLTTRDGAVVHLGDNRSGRGDGDDETITVDLARVHPRIDTIVFLVTSYQGHTLEWINRAYCRLLDDAQVELARVSLTGGVPQTGMVLAKLLRDGDRWRLRAVCEGIAAKVPAEAVDALRPFV
ncbi:MAG: TerD family protein [Nocardioides sp.]